MNSFSPWRIGWFSCSIVIVSAFTSCLAEDDVRRLIVAWEKDVRGFYGFPVKGSALPKGDIDWKRFRILEKNLTEWRLFPLGYNIGEYQVIREFASSTNLRKSGNQDLNKLILTHLKENSSAYPEFLAMILCDRLGLEYIQLLKKHIGIDNMWEIDKAVLKEFQSNADGD